MPVQDYGETVNADVAARFSIEPDEFPVFYLFPRDSPLDEAVLYRSVAPRCLPVSVRVPFQQDAGFDRRAILPVRSRSSHNVTGLVRQRLAYTRGFSAPAAAVQRAIQAAWHHPEIRQDRRQVHDRRLSR